VILSHQQTHRCLGTSSLLNKLGPFVFKGFLCTVTLQTIPWLFKGLFGYFRNRGNICRQTVSIFPSVSQMILFLETETNRKASRISMHRFKYTWTSMGLETCLPFATLCWEFGELSSVLIKWLTPETRLNCSAQASSPNFPRPLRPHSQSL